MIDQHQPAVPSALRWEEVGRFRDAFSGVVKVGAVLQSGDRWRWQVQMSADTAEQGYVVTEAEAKAAVEGAWLKTTGLSPIPPRPEHGTLTVVPGAVGYWTIVGTDGIIRATTDDEALANLFANAGGLVEALKRISDLHHGADAIAIAKRIAREALAELAKIGGAS